MQTISYQTTEVITNKKEFRAPDGEVYIRASNSSGQSVYFGQRVRNGRVQYITIDCSTNGVSYDTISGQDFTQGRLSEFLERYENPRLESRSNFDAILQSIIHPIS